MLCRSDAWRSNATCLGSEMQTADVVERAMLVAKAPRTMVLAPLSLDAKTPKFVYPHVATAAAEVMLDRLAAITCANPKDLPLLSTVC